VYSPEICCILSFASHSCCSVLFRSSNICRMLSESHQCVVQAVVAYAHHDWTEADENIVASGADVPEPMFPGNRRRESNSCLLNQQLR
jgi:hypothetical protein